MTKNKLRSYSTETNIAIKLLAKLIRVARVEQRISGKELAERAGIARSTLQRVENADPKCEIGIVFELASLLNIRLFELEEAGLQHELKQLERKLTLLPNRVRTDKTDEVDDDF